MHVPVLLKESISFLNPAPAGLYADLTLGLGGHSEAILESTAPDGRLIAFDKDPEAVRRSTERLARFSGRLTIVRADFRQAAGIIREMGLPPLSGFLMDLGVSTMQLKTAERGFSFSMDAPLDMRMDTEAGETASDLVNGLSEREIEDIIFKFGEERWARKIARKIVERRSVSPVRTTKELAEIVSSAIPRGAWPPKTHPATRTFQGLRIAVNDELGALSEALEDMLGLLGPGGRAVVLSYHSLEDRLVKQKFRDWAAGCRCPKEFPVCICGGKPRLKVLTTRAAVPEEQETRDNPSARSVKLRAAERL